jgi:polar amino acid transport system substrate-binding protein
MRSVLRRPVIAAGVLALTIGAAAACSSSSSGGTQTVTPPTQTSTASAGAGVNAAAAALVPASIKSKGSLLVAADASYAPNEFLAANGKTVVGMDADLAADLGKVLGLKVKVENITFDSIIPGMVDGRYDLGMSSFTDTLARQKQVNFVTYFSAGTSFFVKSSGGPTINTLADLCGHKVAVESGTTEETDAKGQAKKCTAAGKSADQVLSFVTQSSANLALSSGRADVGMADSPVAAYQVAQSHGTFKLTGQAYGTAPYGIAVPKQAGTMDKAVLAALKVLMSDGTYAKILAHWGIQSGAITNPVINGATS